MYIHINYNRTAKYKSLSQLFTEKKKKRNFILISSLAIFQWKNCIIKNT